MNKVADADGGPLTAAADLEIQSQSRLHRAFSPARIAAICANTLTDLTRQKVFYFLLFFGLLLIGGSVFLARDMGRRG